MNDHYTISMFLKFGNENNITDLYKNGVIFMSPIQRFREIEDGELRGDIYEGARRIRNYLPGDFEIPAIGFKGKHLGVHLKESYEEVLGNIYSLYCISSHGWDKPDDVVIDTRIKKFGSHCLVVKDNHLFFSRIKEKLTQLGAKFTHGFINYYDRKSINRDITLFEKPLEFEYQKEFRFYVERDSTEPFKFSIGSLSDISEIMPASSVVDTLKLHTTKNKG